MNHDELIAEMDAAYEIEKASQEVVRQLAALAGDAVARAIWRLAFNKGRQHGLKQAQAILNER